MEANECDSSHLDSDVLLPPRKRLLAGLKRQSSETTWQGSGSPESSSSTPLNEYNTRLQNLLKSYKNGSRMSPEEIAEAARSAASSAAKAAMAARASAEEKAAIALKAVAAAKDAMSLVASFSKGKGNFERQSRKNKLKKHVQVQNLYTNQASDEIAESTRVLKHSPGSEANIKHKKSSSGEVIDSQASKSSKSDSVVEISGELIESPDDMHVNGRKRGRTKQKKLPLSFCSLKDRANPRDELKESSSGDTSMSIEPAQTWKCQDFKVPQCITPNQVMQS